MVESTDCTSTSSESALASEAIGRGGASTPALGPDAPAAGAAGLPAAGTGAASRSDGLRLAHASSRSGTAPRIHLSEGGMAQYSAARPNAFRRNVLPEFSFRTGHGGGILRRPFRPSSP